MSEVVSALMGASYDGFCQVEEAGLVGMITLRGDLASANLAKAVKAATGAIVPGQGCVETGKTGRVAWMSPDELLLIVEHTGVAAMIGKLAKALKGDHALVSDVSDARAMFRVSGTGAREVIAKLSPADMAPEGFGPGQFRRTRLAQVPAAFHMPDDDSFEIVCFRSVATYVFGLLSLSAKPGSEVGYFAAGT